MNMRQGRRTAHDGDYTYNMRHMHMSIYSCTVCATTATPRPRRLSRVA